MVQSASVEVGDAPKKGEGKIRRAFVSPKKLIERPAEGNLQNMADVLEHAVKSEYMLDKGRQTTSLLIHETATEFTNKPMCGYRDLIKIHKEEKEITKKVEGKEVKGKFERLSPGSLSSKTLPTTYRDEEVAVLRAERLQGARRGT
jgi:long-chain acyl-CoA synthetase